MPDAQVGSTLVVLIVSIMTRNHCPRVASTLLSPLIGQFLRTTLNLFFLSFHVFSVAWNFEGCPSFSYIYSDVVSVLSALCWQSIYLRYKLRWALRRSFFSMYSWLSWVEPSVGFIAIERAFDNILAFWWVHPSNGQSCQDNLSEIFENLKKNQNKLL